MRLPQTIRRLFRLGLVRPEVRRDLDDELGFHFEETIRDLIASGLTEAEARERARERFGDERAYRYTLERIDDGRVRTERWIGWWNVLRQSLASVRRSAARYPVQTAGVVITLGLGIGANATMYGIVDRLFLQPPQHVVDAERVRKVLLERPGGPNGEMITSNLSNYPDYSDLKSHDGLAVAGYTGWHEATAGDGTSATFVRVASASADFFPLLGVVPLRGRFFTPEEAASGATLTAVVSAEYWSRAHGADPDFVGRTIEVSGIDHMVIGVAPVGFTGVDLEQVDVWVPLEATRAAGGRGLGSRGSRWMKTVSRLKEGVGIEVAEAEATTLVVNARRAEASRSTDRVQVFLESVVVARGSEAPAESRLSLWLLGVSFIVLMIACANVANLLAARTAGRWRELAVRMALGAGRRRVVGQMIVESVLLSLAGGLLAIGLAQWGGAIVRSTLLPEVYFPSSALGWRLFGFTALVALFAGVMAAIGPAL